MAGTYVKEVQLAGILHDIGKFYQKSGRKGAEVAGIMVKGHHAQVSSSFIENYRKQFIKYDIDVDAVKEMVQRHHTSDRNNNGDVLVSKAKPEYKNICNLVNYADNISSSERFDNTDVGSGTSYITEPLTSVLSVWATGSKHNYPVGEMEAYFDKASDTHLKNDSELNEKWIKHFANRIESWVFEAETFEEMFNRIDETLREYLWCFPSDSTQRLADVSLYDHLKTTSAIAAVMYDELVNNPENQTGMKSINKEMGWEFKDSASKTVDKFTLIRVGIENIEEFILDNELTHEVKNLRFVDNNKRYAEDKLNKFIKAVLNSGGLTEANIVINQQFNKYILVNTSRLCDIVNYINEINREVCVETSMKIGLCMSSIEIPRDDMDAQNIYKYIKQLDMNFNTKSGNYINHTALIVNTEGWANSAALFGTKAIYTCVKATKSDEITEFIENTPNKTLALVTMQISNLTEAYDNMFKASNIKIKEATKTVSSKLAVSMKAAGINDEALGRKESDGVIEYGTLSRIATANRLVNEALEQLENTNTATVSRTMNSITFITPADGIMETLNVFKTRISKMSFNGFNVTADFVTFNINDEIEYVHDNLERIRDKVNESGKRTDIYYNGRPMRWVDIEQAEKLTEAVKKSVKLNKSNLYRIREFIEGYYEARKTGKNKPALGISRFFNKKNKGHLSPRHTDPYLVEFVEVAFKKFMHEDKHNHMLGILSEIINDNISIDTEE